MKIESTILKYLLVSLLLFGFSACSSIPETRNITTEFSNLNRIDPIPLTLALVKGEKYAEANDYLSYFLELDYVKNDFDANALNETIQAKRNDWKYLTAKATQGCLDGKSNELGGLTAATICDALVIGDMRDLWAQGKNYIEGTDVDKLALALASMGIGATLATIATMGTSSSIKPAIAFLKVSNKTGKTPDWLKTYLQNLVTNPNKNHSLKEFAGLTETLWKSVQVAGPKATLELFSKSKSIEDFQKLAKFGAQFGNKTTTLLKLGGDDVIDLAQHSKTIPNQLYFEASSFGKAGIKALNNGGMQKFKGFVDSDNIARRRMTNFEMNVIASGKRVSVLGHSFIQKDNQFNPFFLDGAGKSNLDRMRLGLAPIGTDGNPINLHHMKQQKNGDLVEMTASDHREYSELLHRYSRVSEINREEFNLLKIAYWKFRAEGFAK